MKRQAVKIPILAAALARLAANADEPMSDNVISVSGGTAQKVSTPAAFTFTRVSASGVYPQITVPYTVDPSSTAIPNLDYDPPLSNGSVTFEASQTTAPPIPVMPQENPNQTGARYITLDLTPSTTLAYTLASASATVAILDDKPPKRAVAINALVVGGSSDPWTMVDASLVDAMTVNGGVAGVGTSTLPRTGSNPSPSLTIQPDLGFLSGSKIPPLTPNVFDIRIMTSNESPSSP